MSPFMTISEHFVKSFDIKVEVEVDEKTKKFVESMSKSMKTIFSSNPRDNKKEKEIK